MPIMTSPTQITPAWLTEVLQRGGHLTQGQVESIGTANPSASVEGPGFQSSQRLVVYYSANAAPTAPRRLYLKAQAGGSHPEAGGRELQFYQAVATHMPYSPAPRCFDAAHDSTRGAYHLLLEDVSETHRTIHPEEPATAADTEQMLTTLARLHAHWWGHSQLGHTIGEMPDPIAINADFQNLRDALPRYVDFLGDRLSVSRQQIYQRVLEQYPTVLLQRLAERATLTLVHYDAHVGNFLLPRHPALPAYLIDWQQWGVSIGMRDVAYQLALFWYPERRARFEQAAVKQYHRQLQAYGVQGYEWSTCWTDYRLQVIENLLVPFWAWMFQGAQWGFHRWHQLEKAFLAFQDLECAELLP